MSGFQPGDENATAEDVLDWLAKMRVNEPVHVDDQDVWHLFRYDDVRAALFDRKTFASDTNRFVPSNPEFERFSTGNILNMDNPKHSELRGLIVEAFTPRLIEGLAPRITEITGELLDRIPRGEPTDLVDALTYPLPVMVIAELLGIPVSDRGLFRRWADALLGNRNTDATVVPEEEAIESLANPLHEMGEYLREHVRRRRGRETDDLIGKLVGADVRGRRLSDDEITGFAGSLLIAGHITTTAALGNALCCFDRVPEAAQQIREDIGLLPNAIEEVLRFRPPFIRVIRMTTTDTEVAGTTIPADRLLIPWLAAANHDPDRFDDPGRFDIHRDANGHVSFGYGIHFCVGSRLARLEAHLVLRMLFERYRSITIDRGSAIEFHNPWSTNAVRKLPVLLAD
ncbi:cytochrome P450 [Amycolatopsis acidiphila]|nr:cytochrome P450 [Amycolatopsis acidiphila]UIJ62062.1 cytochrome P450 [Amycolatopsis acidiphila]GHG99478.1 cytochrome P450 [Amycolatopsis acidiphila]